MRAMMSVMIVAAVTFAGQVHAGEGGISKDQIRKVVRAHIGEVRDCYNQGLQRDPELAGRLVVGFEIAGSGAVNQAKISESTVADAEVGTCIAGKVKSWQFPASSAATTVEYPFVLEPG